MCWHGNIDTHSYIWPATKRKKKLYMSFHSTATSYMFRSFNWHEYNNMMNRSSIRLPVIQKHTKKSSTLLLLLSIYSETLSLLSLIAKLPLKLDLRLEIYDRIPVIFCKQLYFITQILESLRKNMPLSQAQWENVNICPLSSSVVVVIHSITFIRNACIQR